MYVRANISDANEKKFLKSGIYYLHLSCLFRAKIDVTPLYRGEIYFIMHVLFHKEIYCVFDFLRVLFLQICESRVQR